MNKVVSFGDESKILMSYLYIEVNTEQCILRVMYFTIYFEGSWGINSKFEITKGQMYCQ